MSARSVSAAATARLRRLWAGLGEMLTLRRREKRAGTYYLRLLCLFLLLVVLPAQKVLQLGVGGALLALVKVGVAVALVSAALWMVFLVEAWAKRRGTRA